MYPLLCAGAVSSNDPQPLQLTFKSNSPIPRSLLPNLNQLLSQIASFAFLPSNASSSAGSVGSKRAASHDEGEEEAQRGSKSGSAASAAAAGGWATAKLLVTLHSNAVEVHITASLHTKRHTEETWPPSWIPGGSSS